MSSNNNPSPRSDDDTFDLIDDALASLAAHRGVWLGDDLATSALLASLTEQTQRCLPMLVHDARANGRTWHEIAHALGTSPTKRDCASTPTHPSPTPDGPPLLTATDPNPNCRHRVRSLLTNIDHDFDPEVRSQLTNIRGHFTLSQPVDGGAAPWC